MSGGPSDVVPDGRDSVYEDLYGQYKRLIANREIVTVMHSLYDASRKV